MLCIAQASLICIPPIHALFARVKAPTLSCNLPSSPPPLPPTSNLAGHFISIALIITSTTTPIRLTFFMCAPPSIVRILS
ncbi:hypothetical protein K440DRAFT_231058 [Wilcoxina mikolae CBS 423.85]|nr:hypothetical protein K440DRAFT_231058 [Wilcoxina mikolae CBS 423.85]